jgi:hypothetical protein
MAMRMLLLCLLTLCLSAAVWANTNDISQSTNGTPSVIVIMGAAGESEFGSNFVHQVAQWRSACSAAGASLKVIGADPVDSVQDHELIENALRDAPKNSAASLWLVLIGHGTFDGHEARFNLRGPDVSATELAVWLQPFQRTLAIINTASASAPFINRLSASNRIIMSATRSGEEQNFTRFGQFLAEALNDPASDLDADQQISLLEAFLSSAHRTAEFYQNAGRLASEHALIDDNGDGMGTPADWFRGVRAVKKAADGAVLDGSLAHQITLLPNLEERSWSPERRMRRDALEREVFLLREAKSNLPPDEYYRQLEALLLQIANLVENNKTQ